MSKKLQLRIFLEPNGKMPARGKCGDAGLDVFADILAGVTFTEPFMDCNISPEQPVPREVDLAQYRQGETPGTVWVCSGDSVKIPLGFRYSFYEEKEEVTWQGNVKTTKFTKGISHDYWLDIRNRSGVGTKAVMVTTAEVGDANYRGVINYCAAKVGRNPTLFQHGDKIAQAIITPFIDPFLVEIVQVSSIEELGPSLRGASGFGASGST